VKGPGYPSGTFRVLKDKEIRQFGEYRTHRLVMAAWGRLERDTRRKQTRAGSVTRRPHGFAPNPLVSGFPENRLPGQPDNVVSRFQECARIGAGGAEWRSSPSPR
jgi:hypothetical protein